MSQKSNGEGDVGAKVQVVDADETCPRLPLVDGDGSAWAVIWPGIGAHERSMHLFALSECSRTVPMEHPSEATYYVIEGAAVAIDLADDSRQEAEMGSMIFVEPGTRYVVTSDGGPARFVGGPCPPDPSLYEGMSDV